MKKKTAKKKSAFTTIENHPIASLLFLGCPFCYIFFAVNGNLNEFWGVISVFLWLGSAGWLAIAAPEQFD